ncbi:MAG TPA: GNAT family N-acetyltransferase [Bryobacteraceae bacterium]|jgi:GNAT superfamily N-acetyltransferase|nr:GNAT family N-acetyltransferase [Bryobacteraceae bacterium]
MPVSVSATLAIRAPHTGEWPVCRALLPEAFRESRAPDALLAFDTAGAPVACAAFQWTGDAIHELRIRVIRTRRREGVGRALLKSVVALAAARCAGEIHARVNPVAEPDADPFLIASGFRRTSRLLTVEAPPEPLAGTIARLARRGKPPSGARIAEIAEVDRGRLAALYTNRIVPELRLPPGAAAPLVWDRRFADSPVLLVDGALAGMLLMEANNGEGVCVIVARAVEPEYRGRGWANLLLLSEGFARGRRRGSTRMRFEAPEDNGDTMKLMARANGQLVGAAACYVRTVGHV